jgi:hypothetical protein
MGGVFNVPKTIGDGPINVAHSKKKIKKKNVSTPMN